MKTVKKLSLLSLLLVSSCQDIHSQPVRELCILNSQDLFCQDPRKGDADAEQQYNVEFADALGYLCVTQATYDDYYQYGVDKVKELKLCENELSRLKAMCRQ